MKRFRSALGLSAWQCAGIAIVLMLGAAFAAPKLIDTFRFSVPVKVAAPLVKLAASPGERVYIKWCAECHASSIGPGTQALERRYKGEVPAILDQRPGMPADFVKYAVRHGMSFMPPFRKTEISDSELAHLAAYLASVKALPADKKAGPIQ